MGSRSERELFQSVTKRSFNVDCNVDGTITSTVMCLREPVKCARESISCNEFSGDYQRFRQMGAAVYFEGSTQSVSVTDCVNFSAVSLLSFGLRDATVNEQCRYGIER